MNWYDLADQAQTWETWLLANFTVVVMEAISQAVHECVALIILRNLQVSCRNQREAKIVCGATHLPD